MTSEAAAAGVIVLIIFAVMIIGLLLFAVPALIVNWQLFTKAGKPG